MKTHLRGQSDRKTESQKILLLVLIFLTTGLLVFRLVKANSYVDDSSQVAKLEDEARAIKTENESLAFHVRRVSSLTVLADRAEKLGLVKTTSYTYLPAPLDLAFGLQSN